MLKLLLKVRFASMFTRQRSVNGKRASGGGKRIILFLFLLFYAGTSIFIMLHTMYRDLMPVLIQNELVWYVFGISTLVSALLSLLLDAQSARSQLYEAHDNDLLMSMPIPPGTILLSRLLSIYLFSLAYAVILYLPAVVVCVQNGQMSAFQVIGALFCILLVEWIPVAISCLVGRFLAYLHKRFTHFRIVSAVVTGVLLLAYLYFSMNLSNVIGRITADPVSYASTFKKTAWPLYLVARACTGDPLFIALLVLLTAVICIPVYFYLSRTFLKSVGSAKASRKKARASRSRALSPMRTLVLREIEHFTGNTSYMVNAGFGLLIELAFSVFFLIRKGSLFLYNPAFLPVGFADVLPALVLSLLQTMVMISACMVSLERNNIWIVQSLPVTPDKVLLSKALAQFAICLPFTLVSSLLCIIAQKSLSLASVWIILSPLAMALLASFIGVRVNMMFPRLDYIDDITVIKRSASVMVSMLLMWPIAGFSIIPLFLPSIPLHAAMAFHTLIPLLICLPIIHYLRHRGARAFAHLA